MQFVDGNPNDRGFQLKERDCLLQSGASSHCDRASLRAFVVESLKIRLSPVMTRHLNLTRWSKMVEELFGMSQKVGFTDHISNVARTEGFNTSRLKPLIPLKER